MRLVGAVVFSLGLTLIACGGSSGREAPDGAAGSGGHGGSGGGGAAGVPSGVGGATGDDGGAPDASAAETSTTLPDALDAGEARPAADTGQESFALCSAVTIDAPAAQVTIRDNGAAIDEDGFQGGAIGSGTWVLTQIVHFGPTYAGPTRALWIVDATARTLEAASLHGETATSVKYALANASTSILTGFPSCGAAAPSNWNYLVEGATLSVNLRGSSDVLLFTRQGASVGEVVGP
jgi:hypothetical protein